MDGGLMRIAVYGAGALGSVIGGLMAESHNITLICREDHAREINANGLRLDGLVERKVFPKATTDAEGLPVQDLVILTVKAYDTRASMCSVAQLLGERTPLLTIQNGLTVLRDVMELRPGSMIGITNLGADYVGPGHVRLTGLGEVAMGGLEGPDDSQDIVLESFRPAGIPCRRSPDIRKDVWKKAVISSCINPITAITRKLNAVIIDDRDINDLARLCFRESCSVGSSTGQFGPQDLTFTEVENLARATAGNRSSMLQDVERGKRTEIDHINGEIARVGTEAGLDVRLNRAFVSLVSSLSR